MITFKRIREFNVSAVLQAIKELQDAVLALQPMKSSGTLINQSPKGTTIRANRATKSSGGGVAPTSDQPARWQ